jgi:hypothetical protein
MLSKLKRGVKSGFMRMAKGLKGKFLRQRLKKLGRLKKNVLRREAERLFWDQTRIQRLKIFHG